VAVKLPLTLIEIDINKLGRVVNCRIAASSGQSQLDEKACSIALARFRFQPAMMNGEPVASKKTMPIKWAVNGGEAK
jgi:TonB family protein